MHVRRLLSIDEKTSLYKESHSFRAQVERRKHSQSRSTEVNLLLRCAAVTIFSPRIPAPKLRLILCQSLQSNVAKIRNAYCPPFMGGEAVRLFRGKQSLI